MRGEAELTYRFSFSIPGEFEADDRFGLFPETENARVCGMRTKKSPGHKVSNSAQGRVKPKRVSHLIQ
jgi:hypothetical protein